MISKKSLKLWIYNTYEFISWPIKFSLLLVNAHYRFFLLCIREKRKKKSDSVHEYSDEFLRIFEIILSYLIKERKKILIAGDKKFSKYFLNFSNHVTFHEIQTKSYIFKYEFGKIDKKENCNTICIVNVIEKIPPIFITKFVSELSKTVAKDTLLILYVKSLNYEIKKGISELYFLSILQKYGFRINSINAIRNKNDIGSIYKYLFISQKNTERFDNTLLIDFPATFGDVVTLTALLPLLHEKYDNIKIIIKSYYPEIFFFNPYCDNYFFGQEPKFAIKLTTKPDHSSRKLHIVDVLADRLDIKTPVLDKRPRLFIQQYERELLFRKFPILHGTSYIIIAPFSRWQSKNWALDKWEKLVESIKLNFNIEIIQLGSTSEPLINNVLDLRGKTSIRESGIILEKAKLIISVDNGVHHLAVALRKKCITLFGPLLAKNIMYDNYTIPIQNNSVCHGCYNDIEKPPDYVPVFCPINTNECMQEISVKTVINIVINEME